MVTNTAPATLGEVRTTEPAPSATVPTPTVTTEASETPTSVPPPAIPMIEDEPTAVATMDLSDLSLTAEAISFYPVPAVYDGDLVTIKVAANIPRGIAPNDVEVHVRIDDEFLVSGNLNSRNIDGDSFGLYQWVWDASDEAGEHIVSVVLDPENLIQTGDEIEDNNQASTTLSVQPRRALSELEADARWVAAANNCCTLHVVSGTAAHRDLNRLMVEVDAAFQQAAAQLGEPLIESYNVYLIDRVIGQGGYSSEAMVISYLDRDYAGGGLNEVLVHEAVHLIDKQFAPERITFLSEGVAVWAAGGHYQQADLGQRMAALIEMGRFIPIVQVIDNFFATQHEIGYVEAGSFISYLVETYGWPQVRAFYSDASADDGATLSSAVDANLQLFLGKTLEQMEAEWLAYLSGLPRDRTAVSDLGTTIRFFDLMRRYQLLFDPTAYYRLTWLPSPREAELRSATADLSRHPESKTNIALETLLYSAYVSLYDGDFQRANAQLDSIERVLDSEGNFLDPLARSHLEIVESAAREGYEVQQIQLDGNQATAFATQPNGPDLIPLNFFLRGQSWLFWR